MDDVRTKLVVAEVKKNIICCEKLSYYYKLFDNSDRTIYLRAIEGRACHISINGVRYLVPKYFFDDIINKWALE